MEFLSRNTPSNSRYTVVRRQHTCPLAIASIGAHWGLITESPNELIFSLTNFSVKLNTHYTTATYRCLALVSSNQYYEIESTSERGKRENPGKNHAVHSKTSQNDCLRVRRSQTLHESAREANPTRLRILKEEACVPASEVEDITYMWSKNLTDNYGLLAISPVLQRTLSPTNQHPTTPAS